MSSFNLWSIRIADSPADEGHPFGHGKAENLAGLVQVVFIGLVGGALLAEAVRRLIQGTRPDHPEWGIAIMAVSTVVSWLITRHLQRVAHETDSIALHADSLHYATDVWTNAGVMAGLGLLWLTGSGLFDALIAIGVAAVILGSAYRLLVRSINELMDAALPASEQRAIEEVIHRHRFRRRPSQPEDASVRLPAAHRLHDRVVPPPPARRGPRPRGPRRAGDRGGHPRRPRRRARRADPRLRGRESVRQPREGRGSPRPSHGAVSPGRRARAGRDRGGARCERPPKLVSGDPP